jgi:hypothetical protein
MKSRRREREDVVLLTEACTALAALVRAEYPARMRLADIAARWGEGLSEQQVEAVEWFEQLRGVTG